MASFSSSFGVGSRRSSLNTVLFPGSSFVSYCRSKRVYSGRPLGVVRVFALFGRRSKSKKNEVETSDGVVKETIQTKEEQTVDGKVLHEVVAIEPSLATKLLPQNTGATLFAGSIIGFCFYLVYLVFFKDRREVVGKIDVELNRVIRQLEDLKKMRGESELSEAELLRVRSFLLSSLISGKKETSVVIINNALRLIGSKNITKEEKEILFESEEMAQSIVDCLTTIPAMEENYEIRRLPPVVESPSAEPWWNKLPYICVLRLKKTGALFMADVGSTAHPKYAIVGFEDPEEGLIAGKIPPGKQLWGVASRMKKTGAKPSRPTEIEKHFDLTWLSPKELHIMIDSVGCYGLVIPAGTLRTGPYGLQIPSKQVLPKILEVSLSTEHGYLSPVIAKKEETEEIPTNEISSVFESDGIADAVPVEVLVNGTHSGEASSGDGDSVLDAQIPVNGHPSEPPIYVNGEVKLNKEEDKEPEENEPWWMELPRLIVPKLKGENEEGGNVEINVSINPKEEDFRPVLFEAERDAKYFLGILGKLSGPNTLVAVISETPEQFLRHNPDVEKSRVVVLCKGALLLDKTATKEGVKTAVRLAQRATEIKKGGLSSLRDGKGSSFDERAFKVAEDMLKKYQTRIQINEENDAKKGDERYIDPVNGMLRDLQSGGIDELFGGETASVKDNFGFKKGSKEDDVYKKFVEKMDQKVSDRVDEIQKKVDQEEQTESEEVELEADLDSLVDNLHAEEQPQEEEEEDDEFEVVYPDSKADGAYSSTGPEWFLSLKVVFMPQYLSSAGGPTFLAFSNPEIENKKLVVGFEDQTDAKFCKELMRTWSSDENMASGIAQMEPSGLLEVCEEHDVIPVVLRKSSITMTSSMTMNEFFGFVLMIFTTQAADFPIFNG